MKFHDSNKLIKYMLKTIKIQNLSLVNLASFYVQACGKDFYLYTDKPKKTDSVFNGLQFYFEKRIKK